MPDAANSDGEVRVPQTGRLRVIAPFVVLLIVGAVAAASMLAIAARSLNDRAQSTETALAHSAVASRVRALEKLAFDYSWWDEVNDEIVVAGNMEWAEDNLGAYLTETFDVAYSFVLGRGPADRTVVGFRAGAQVPGADAFRMIPAATLRALVARARTAPWNEPMAHSAMTMVDAAPHIVAVSAITPENPQQPSGAEAHRPILVVVSALDAGVLGGLASAFQLDGLRFQADRAGAATVTLAGIDGGPIGYLAWTPKVPGTEFAHRYGPMLAGVFAVMIVLTVLFVRRAVAVWEDGLHLKARLAQEQERRRHEAEIARFQRLSTVGEMTTTLAHELNQPLTAISAYAQGCVEKFQHGAVNGDRGDIADALNQLVVQAERASTILRRVHGFLRREDPAPAPADINALVTEAAEFMQGALRDNGIDLVRDLAADLPPVTINPVQVQQVVVNLVQNAIDAMAERPGRAKRITIRTGTGAGNEVTVSVIDTGPGLSPEAADNLFTLFYTTKPNGLGMGLAISRSIVEAQGGQLTAGAGPGGGAVFQFSLPVSGALRHAG